MSIKSHSQFFYGHEIIENNQFINFSENAGPELTATLDVGSYSLTNFALEFVRSLNSAGNLEYQASINRETRAITITANGDFKLLPQGSLEAVSALPLAGFTIDTSLSNTATSDTGSGRVFRPQFLLQRFVDFQDNVKSVKSNVNESASGIIEVVNYGRVNIMECNITLQTDIEQPSGSVLKNDPNGVENLRDFMEYITRKLNIEFMPDMDNPNNFDQCILESTTSGRDGTSFVLSELYARGLVGYFESKALKFRRVF